jgi:hypothetical protein
MDEKNVSIVVEQFIELQAGLVSKSNIERWLNSLISFHNRHSKSTYSHQVTSWLIKELEISGYKNKDKKKKEDKDKYKDVVDFHRFTGNGIKFKNIIVISRIEQMNLFLSVDIMIIY